jgi:hypothetical protein
MMISGMFSVRFSDILVDQPNEEMKPAHGHSSDWHDGFLPTSKS